MNHLLRAASLLVMPSMLALPLAAQQVPTPSAPESVRPVPYRSAFEGYQPFADEKTVPWKEANDAVGRIGGWRAYARQAQADQPSDPQAPAVPPADPPAGHGKH